MRSILAVLLLLACCVPAHAAETMKTEAETLALARRAMDAAMVDSPAAAFEPLKAYWPLDPVEIDAMKNATQQQWPIVAARFGQPIAYELVSTERIGTSFVRYTFLQKFERYAIRWTLSFYRPKDGWMTSTFKWDDQIETLYTE
jgi:hypothetical protein